MRVFGHGFTVTNQDITNTGPSGAIPGVAGIKWGIPVTPGDVHTVTVGSTTGAVRIDWGEKAVLAGEAVFTTPGVYEWTVPAGVTSVSAVAVGGGGSGGVRNNGYAAGGTGGSLGWKNAIPVTPGETVTITVGAGGTKVDQALGTANGVTGGASSFGTVLAAPGGSGGGTGGTPVSGVAPAVGADGGGTGGLPQNSVGAGSSGGGGAAGYSGNGGTASRGN